MEMLLLVSCTQIQSAKPAKHFPLTHLAVLRETYLNNFKLLANIKMALVIFAQPIKRDDNESCIRANKHEMT